MRSGVCELKETIRMDNASVILLLLTACEEAFNCCSQRVVDWFQNT